MTLEEGPSITSWLLALGAMEGVVTFWSVLIIFNSTHSGTRDHEKHSSKADSAGWCLKQLVVLSVKLFAAPLFIFMPMSQL